MTLSVPATQTGLCHHISSAPIVVPPRRMGAGWNHMPWLTLLFLQNPCCRWSYHYRKCFVGLVCFVKRDDLDIFAEPSPVGPMANTTMLAEPG